MTYRWQINIWKDALTSYAIGQICKLKQVDLTTHLLEQLKSKTLTTLNAGENMEQKELPFIAGGNANGTAILENGLTVSYKAKHTLTI